MSSKWAVELVGEPFDLANLTTKLNESIATVLSPFICRFNELYVLRSRRWDSAVAASAVEMLAKDDLGAIRGCVDALDICGNVDLGTVFEFPENYDVPNQTRTTPMKVRTL